MIEFKENTPTIAQVYQYTYLNRHTFTRFFNEERDVLKTKIKIERREVYKRNKENKWTTPSTRLVVFSESTPQYYPYTKIKSKNAKKQRKIHHEYDVTLIIQDTPNGYDFWNSKMIWRTGSFRKVPKNIPQSKVKQIHKETLEKLERKYKKLPQKQKAEMIRRECEKIRKRATYISDGDFIARTTGIMLDAYYRDHFIQKKYNCLYGRCWTDKEYKGISFPFADKHLLAILNFCLRRGIIKYK